MAIAAVNTGKVRAAIVGAVVGDAASLGFQWLYDPERIASIEAAQPEFHTPNEKDFAGTIGYFIGTNKAPGDLSGYGEQVLVALRASAGGNWVATNFVAEFGKAFERGGTYSGYMDSASLAVLDNVTAHNKKLLEEAIAAAGVDNDGWKGFMRGSLIKKGGALSGETFVAEYGKMVGGFFKDEVAGAKAREAALYYDARRPVVVGADDDQITGLVKLPVVVALTAGTPAFEQSVKDAVRITNNNDCAVAYGILFARLLAKLLDASPATTTVARAIEEALSEVPDSFELHDRVRKALALNVRELGAAGLSATFERGSCPVKNTVPIVMAIAAVPSITYAEAIRINILTGGDSCGRAVLLGAILGAANGLGTTNGVPLSWLGRVNGFARVAQTLETATPSA